MVVDGKPSYLETEAAGPALAKQARERIAAGEESALRTIVDGDLNRIDSKVIGQAAAAGDALALDIVTRAGRIIGLGIVSLLQLFNPEVIVIGGGVSNIGPLLFDPMHAAIREYVTDPAYLEGLRIERAALGDDVSIIGAAALVQTEGGFVPLLEGR
jgi:glucokinase